LVNSVCYVLTPSFGKGGGEERGKLVGSIDSIHYIYNIQPIQEKRKKESGRGQKPTIARIAFSSSLSIPRKNEEGRKKREGKRRRRALALFGETYDCLVLDRERGGGRKKKPRGKKEGEGGEGGMDLATMSPHCCY